MHFTSVAISALLASVAYSQSVGSEVAQLPSCALSCLANASTAAGCGIADYACQCGDAQSAITKSATPCITAACDSKDVSTIPKIAAKICELQASAGSSSASSSSASSSVASNISSASGSYIASATHSRSSVASSAGSSATPTAPTATASPSPSTAAGNRFGAAGAIVGAGLLAAFAL
ncbi:hypothetical protein DSL72_006594 [Monilinia vaccinii-corymbosi]|uniref:CFEM domain-containing protein n=1 Tax=Monilinia vaccinii-corymbosi TaxID=61207 RepID=A0A8A3PPB4_9HELO|nr:hypothetical protein DSL72_006594 [Monilinia vaccinii-corymbosi]